MGNGTPLINRSSQNAGAHNKSKAPQKTGQIGAARSRRAARSQQANSAANIPLDATPRLDLSAGSPAGRASGTAVQKSAAPRRPIGLGFDVYMLIGACTLTVVGMVFLFSASWRYSLLEHGSPYTVFLRQLLWLSVGLGVAAFLVWMDYRHWQKLALPLMGATIFGLLAVIFLQEERHGAVRTLFGGSYQPSELAKLAIILYLSVWLYNRRDQLRDFSLGLVPMGVILGVVGALIAVQPDLSALITIMLLGIILFFLAGGELLQIGFVLVTGLSAGWLLLRTPFLRVGLYRIETFLAGLQNPFEASAHVQRAMEAFVQGGWFGAGIGKSISKLTVLPFPHTDSIFAVIGEETGVFGASIMVLLYAFILWRGMLIAQRAPDKLGSLLAAGLILWITLEALINMAGIVGLMPFAGNALPLVSSGGSNRLVTLAAIGILLNISRLSERNREEEERTFSAVVDLRRRDWRGGEPRSRRPSNPGLKG
jgi:cell division protein FtsW